MAKKKTQDPNNEDAPNVTIQDSNRLQSQDEDLKVATAAITDPSLSKDELQKELRRFLIPKLRSASYRWKYRSEAMKKARVSRGLYKCAMCQNSELKNGDFAIDHVESVVPLDGWQGDWNLYIERMFCKTEGFQVLCFSCHSLKTSMEVEIRKMRREEKKKKQNG